MHDYKNDLAPWSLYKDNIKSVIIEGDVTYIENNAFPASNSAEKIAVIKNEN